MRAQAAEAELVQKARKSRVEARKQARVRERGTPRRRHGSADGFCLFRAQRRDELQELLAPYAKACACGMARACRGP